MDYDNLLNENVIKIIGSLNGNRLYFNQISELANIKSKNNLLKNLNNMAKLRVLKKEKNKNNTFYSINYNNQFSLILLQLINTKKLLSLPFERRRALIELVHNLRPLIAVLFGSTAKGSFKKDSDIDILLIYDSKTKVINKEVRDIGSKYGVKINPIILKFPELNTNDDTVKHIFKTGYPITGHIYFYEVFKNV